jgi:hypothetical protein
MTNEIRHGPVTMHRAIERRLLREIAARPADAPRKNTAEDTDSGGQAAAERVQASGTKPDSPKILRPGSGRTGQGKAGARAPTQPKRPT